MAKSDSDASLNFWAIVVYIWIFCLYMLLFKSIGEIILFMIDHSPFKDTKDNTIGYGSPIFWIVCFVYEYLLSSWYLMVVYAIVFTIITLVFLILWLVYHIIKPLGFITGNYHTKSPFKNIMVIIDMLDRKSTFTKVLQFYRDELIKIIVNTKFFKSITDFNSANTENFTTYASEDSDASKDASGTEDIIEDFVTASENSEYINDDFREELKDKYEEKNYYYIDAYKHNSHKKSATIYKTLKIRTPLMDDNAVKDIYTFNLNEGNNIGITNQQILNKIN
jgi:hypothetical protein